MGRRYKGVPPEMEEDKGIPGKLYFEKPQVFDIVRVVDPVSNNVSTIDPSATTGPVRLSSTRALRDFTKNSEVSYRIGQRPNLPEIQDYIRWAEIQGFGMGAVVARRWCAYWRAEATSQWGVITGCQVYTVASSSSELYTPFQVQWFDKGLPTEGVWAEDLYIVHQHLSKSLLTSILEEQAEGVVN